ncbi:MAG: ATP-binding protein [Planctomycetota bacterium]
MSLSLRLTLLLACVIALGAFVGDRLHRGLFEQHFGTVERIKAQDAARLAARVLQEEADDLGRDAVRLAWSDRLHAAIARPSAKIDGELVEPGVLEASGFDVTAILEVDGTVRFLHVQHPDHADWNSLRMLPAESVNLTQLIGRSMDSQGVSEQRGVLAAGLMATELGPMLIAARNLVPATRSEQRRGIVVVGRFLGADLEGELERRLGFGVDVWPVGSNSVPAEAREQQDLATSSPEPVVVPVDDQRLDVYATLNDIHRRPEFLVRTVLQRDISAAAAVAIRSGLLLSLTLSLGLLLTLTIALRALVLRPLAGLTQSVVKIGANEDYSVRVDDGRADELGILARAFDEMLERLEEARRQVIETARAAGMSEIAMGILHNVGNVLNSVNISTSVLSERVTGMCVDDLSRVTQTMRERADDLAKFLTEDPQGQHLQPFLNALVSQLENDRDEIAREITSLSSGIEHVCELVKSQQGLARNTQVIERVAVDGLITDAVKMTERARGSSTTPIVVELEPDLPMLVIDRHKTLEIVVNLVQNARQAIEECAPRPEGHSLRIRAHRTFGGKLRIEVRDSGVGIAPEDLTRIFQLGFTTKPSGSGLGLHSAANGAKTLGGTLSVESPGRGNGATFILELPFGARAEKEAA